MKRQTAKGRSRRSTTAKQRKFRVLSQGTPAMVRGIADTVVIKDENIFFLCKRNGDVPEDKEETYALALATQNPSPSFLQIRGHLF
jgi:hypothetical protein